MNAEVKKIANRICELNGQLYDIYLNGGDSSLNFHNAKRNEFVDVVVFKIIEKNPFQSDLPLLSII